MSRLIPEPPPPAPIKLTIAGDPVPQPRAKAFAFMGKKGKSVGKPTARMYNPDNADGWKRLIFAHASSRRPDQPWDGPVRVDATFWFARQVQMAKWSLPPGPLRHYGRPDRDNLEKALLDALTEACIWKDDGQVCCGEVRKFWCSLDAGPGAIVTITFLEKWEQVLR